MYKRIVNNTFSIFHKVQMCSIYKTVIYPLNPTLPSWAPCLVLFENMK